MCTGLDLLGVAMIESIEAPQRFEGEEEVEEVEVLWKTFRSCFEVILKVFAHMLSTFCPQGMLQL